jgi:beta-phosphoglucomutase
MLSDIQAILFDMDGVLIDAQQWHFEALNEALAIFGFEINENLHKEKFDGLSTATKLDLLSEEFSLPWHLHGVINKVKQYRTLRIAAKLCYPNIAHQVLIDRLRERNIKVGVVTNSIRQTAEFMLTYAGILEKLSVLITNQDVRLPKPSPEGYFLAMEKLGVSSDRTLIVEDGDYGVRAGKLTGATVIRVESVNQVNLDLITKHVPKLI